VTASTTQRRDLDVNVAVFEAWWGADGPFPSELTLAVLLDGTECGGGPLACKLRRLQPRPPCTTWRPQLGLRQPLPLPEGAHIVRLRKVGPAALELSAVTGRGDGGGQDAAAAASAPGDAAPEAVQQPPAPASGPAPVEAPAASAVLLRPRPAGSVGKDAAAAAAAAAAAVAAVAAATAVEEEKQEEAPQAEAAAPAPGASGGSSAAISAAALQALTGLHEIVLPPPGTPEEEAALYTSAPFEAFTQVEAAAQALGLAPAEVDAVCSAVEARTRERNAARRFLRMEFRQLWRACTSGEVGLARAWMARLVAAAGAAAGS
jgi:hypothetical protein